MSSEISSALSFDRGLELLAPEVVLSDLLKTQNVPKFVWSTHIISSEWRWRQWATSIIVMAPAWSRNLSHQAKYENDCWDTVVLLLKRIYIWTPWIWEKLTFLPKTSDTPQWCPGRHFILRSWDRQCSLKSQTRTRHVWHSVQWILWTPRDSHRCWLSPTLILKSFKINFYYWHLVSVSG